ncbi:MAG: iron-containing alcohol dehydrogenase [Stappiaceae bacterium]
MTLITYVTRVHFADGVLEEALWSELEVNDKHRPLIVSDTTHIADDLAERIYAGLPVRASVETFTDVPDIPTEDAARHLAKIYHKTDRDILIAFGRNTAIDLAKITRVAIAHDNPLLTFSQGQGGARRIGQNLPDLFAIPGISGFGASVSAHAPVMLADGQRARIMCKKLIPTVTICDPTLTLGAAPDISASAGADAITRCIEAYLSPGFNPPADGIALDGLNRAAANLHRVLRKDGVVERRELMAASLNGALALQKGLGATHAIGNALETVMDKGLDPGTLSRLLLPAVLQFNANAAKEKYQPLRRILKVKPSVSLADGVEAFFDPLPLPRRLSDLGIDIDQIKEAASLAAHDLASVKSPRAVQSDDLRSIMLSVQ